MRGRGRLERVSRPGAPLERHPYPRIVRSASWPCLDETIPGPRSCTRLARAPEWPRQVLSVEYQPPTKTRLRVPVRPLAGRTLYHYNSATYDDAEDGILDKQEESVRRYEPGGRGELGVGEGDWVRSSPAREIQAPQRSATVSIPGSCGWPSTSQVAGQPLDERRRRLPDWNPGYRSARSGRAGPVYAPAGGTLVPFAPLQSCHR